MSVVAGLLGRRIVRQFIKFCLVGALSTVIDVGLHYVLMFQVPWGDGTLSQALGRWVLETFRPGAPMNGKAYYEASFPLLKVPTTVLAILNSYYWNRKWTFRALGLEALHRQIAKFFLVALIGMGLNVLISSALMAVVPGHPKLSWALATGVATVAVALWNFNGQRLWTFRKDMA